MNEFVAIATFVVLCFLAVYATRYGLKQLYVLSVFIILASNVTVGIEAKMFGVSVSLGVIIYSIIYLLTDIVSEFYERNEAYKLAATNLMVQVAFWIYMFISINAQPSGGQAAYDAMVTLFGNTARITVAAFVASMGAFLDIYLYEWMKDKQWPLWVRNILSTGIGQSLNTALFFTIALYGVIPNLLSVIWTAIAIKLAIAICDTPFIYWAKGVFRSTNNAMNADS